MGYRPSLLCSVSVFSPLVTVSMGRANTCPVRKSPILLGSWENKKILERNKMMRMSLKKLRKIGDPENLLHRAVLINNTLECVRKSESIENTESPCKMNTYDHSNYSPEEEQILNSIRLPAPITPISDTQDITEDNNENKDNGGESDMKRHLKTLQSDTNEKLEENFIKAKKFISKQQVFSKKVLKISLLYDCGNSNSYLVAF